MRKFACVIAVLAMMSRPAQAALIDITFDAWKAAPVQIGDKIFTYIAGGDNFGSAEVVFKSDVLPTQTVYVMDISFGAGLKDTMLDLDYSVTATNPLLEISGLGLDSLIGALGVNFNLTKTYYSSAGHVNQIAQLTSINGSNASVLGSFGQLVYTHVQSTIPAGNVLDAFRDGYIETPIAATVPEPSSIALMTVGGIGLAFGFYRKRVPLAV